jgi:ribose 5-phosphate isomerase A
LAEPAPTPGEHPTRDELSRLAIAGIENGMTVGLGTGRTSSRAIRALADRVARESLRIRCVCTSDTTEALAHELRLPTVDFDGVEEVDLLFDGAGEVDHDLRMLKGQHGAIARQRLVARAARRRIYLVSESKLVTRLGETATLPVAVLSFGLAFVRAELRNLGLSGVVRRNLEGGYFVTDAGSLIIDVMLPDRRPEEIASTLDAVPGVIDHGLFLTEADEVFAESENGSVRRLMRREAAL